MSALDLAALRAALDRATDPEHRRELDDAIDREEHGGSHVLHLVAALGRASELRALLTALAAAVDCESWHEAPAIAAETRTRAVAAEAEVARLAREGDDARRRAQVAKSAAGVAQGERDRAVSALRDLRLAAVRDQQTALVERIDLRERVESLASALRGTEAVVLALRAHYAIPDVLRSGGAILHVNDAQAEVRRVLAENGRAGRMSVQYRAHYACDAGGCVSRITVGDGCASGQRYPAEWFVVRTGNGGTKSPPDRHACSEACRDALLPGATCWITGTGYTTAPSKGGGIWTPVCPCCVPTCGEPATTWFRWEPVCQRCCELATRNLESKGYDAQEALFNVESDLRWIRRGGALPTRPAGDPE
ncbi:MAG: hypothetical protein Q8S73_36825 [Deltaproteobacteria bacterium]|nr:hypothetical protein [Myxococcales bacterium]MDP3219724.1 hypothetical protein [Deltaproteobacteria bacterium]